jgi:chaperone BCS1
MDQLLQDNPYFKAGFGLTLLGTALAIAKSSATLATRSAKRHLVVSMEVTSRDRAYPWILSVLEPKTVARHLTLDTSQNSKHFTPRPGKHLVQYENAYLLVERTRDERAFNIQDGTPFETVTISALKRHSGLVFDLLVKQAMDLQRQARSQGFTVIYRNWGPDWRPFGHPRIRRPLGSVVLDTGISEKVLKDVQEFLKPETQSWYLDRGIPYRRGYLLHGSPGSGKSSFVAAIAGELGLDICVLNLNEPGLTDDRLQHAMVNLPQESLLLLEDVDAAFVRREQAERFGTSVTFSGLLNALDGVVAGEQRLVFMTTNHLEFLDPALVRPGRVDLSVHLGNASADQARRLFMRFFPEAESGLSEEFAKRALSVDRSMAELQGYLLLHKHNPHEAISNL